MAVAVVQSGNYDLQIATGFLLDAFTLDDATRGVIGSTEYVLDGTTEFASVLDGALNVNVRRGRRDQGDTFGAAKCGFDRWPDAHHRLHGVRVDGRQASRWPRHGRYGWHGRHGWHDVILPWHTSPPLKTCSNAGSSGIKTPASSKAGVFCYPQKNLFIEPRVF